MPNFIAFADLEPKDRFAIVIARWNEAITRKLLDGAVAKLQERGVADDVIDVAWVPGAMEIPLVAKRLAKLGRYQAIICLGAVIRGETTHYDYVCAETSRGLQLAQMDTGVPVIFCVLTCDTLEQAIDRAGLKSGNKGFEAGLGAIEMAQLSRKLRASAEIDPKVAASGKARRK